MRNILLSLLFCCAMLPCNAQETEDELSGGNGDAYSIMPMDESLFEEDGIATFILDNTKTKIGRDLYEEFYRQWTGIQLDSASMKQFRASVVANPELAIELEEIPSPGLSNMVAIKVGDLLVWQQFVQVRGDAMGAQVAEAIQEVFQYFISFQEIQNQLNTQDQSGTGIF